jgi:hypothetical protein|tara:strand:- start:941 stop:1360 length:420 start_codon:yes stop_codon:yes gene_type:complete
MGALYPTFVADTYLDHNGDWGTFLCDILKDFEKYEVQIKECGTSEQEDHLTKISADLETSWDHWSNNLDYVFSEKLASAEKKLIVELLLWATGQIEWKALILKQISIHTTYCDHTDLGYQKPFQSYLDVWINNQDFKGL